MKAVRAFAPGTVANLGPGVDVLGLAVTGVGDTVTATRVSDGELRVRNSGHSDIPVDAERNTAAIAVARVRMMAAAESVGFVLDVEKGLPLAGGQGGSAASAVAAAVAVNELLGSPLSEAELLESCLEAEESVSGRHADNVAAALYGGVVLIRSYEPLDVVRLSYPSQLRVVLVHPDQRLGTEAARASLPHSVDLTVALSQAASVGALVAALASRDWDLLARSVEDKIAEPARTHLLPGFADAKTAALAAGALGCSISGSGPSAFAFCDNEKVAQRIGQAMVGAYRSNGVESTVRVCAVDDQGARILDVEP